LITGALNAGGTLSTTLLFNDVLDTNLGFTTFYQLTVKDQGGGQVWNENYQFSGTAANLNTIPPAGSLIASTTGPILLQVNGVTSPNQFKLNAQQGSNMTITDAGNGTWTFAAAAAGGVPTYSTSGVGYFWGPGITDPVVYGVAGFSAVTSTATNLNVCCVQFQLHDSYVIGNMAMWAFGGATVTSHMSVGIYSSNGASKLIDSGVLTMNGVATVAYSTVISPAVTLAAGPYILGFFQDNGLANPMNYANVTNVGVRQAMNASNRIGTRAAFSTNPVTGLATLPASLGVLTAAAFAVSNAMFPSIPVPLFEP